MKKVAITPGEPAGIGPDIVLMAAQQRHPFELVAVADINLLTARAAELNIDILLQEYNPARSRSPSHKNTLSVLHIPVTSEVQPGILNPDNASYVLQTLKIATEKSLQKEFDALITGPVSKAVINDAGIAFSGHTEFLRDACGIDHVVMLLASDKINVALATTHIPLSEVAKQISEKSLLNTMKIIDQHWINYFHRHPKILVAGLNPHAGENGHLGEEDQKIIAPACAEAKTAGLDVQGPLSADTLFQQQADVFLAMYHDQGLPVLKYASFGKAANVTLGLPFVRASVDHGTALHLAASGNANADSLIYAINYANQLVTSYP